MSGLDIARTPALVCMDDVLERNLVEMQRWANSRGVRLRPHAKSHKSAEIARRQLEHGAVGIATAKLAEAEALVAKLGAIDVLVTSPIVSNDALDRAASLSKRCALSLVVDNDATIVPLREQLDAISGTVDVLIDVDVGLARTGVTSASAALRLAERLGGALRLRGVQGYGGHIQHIEHPEQRRLAAQACANQLGDVVEALVEHGHDVSIRSGAGTGSHLAEVDLGILNEIQPGSYVFMDREYRDALGTVEEGRFEQSLFIATRVISANHDTHVTVDAGLKAMATDAGAPTISGRPELSYSFFGDEHGLITSSNGTLPALGEVLWLVPPHCDPTVNLYDEIVLIDSATSRRVPVTSRGLGY